MPTLFLLENYVKVLGYKTHEKLKILCKIMITGVGFFYVALGWHTILANSRGKSNLPLFIGLHSV